MNQVMQGVAILGERRVEIRDFPKPIPKNNQVLLKMEIATICGSDMHYYRSKQKDLGERTGWVAGHEVSGLIEQLGDSVNGLEIGDRVSVFSLYGCGNCEMCRKGFPQFCLTPNSASALAAGQRYSPIRSSGGFADYVLAPSYACLKMPSEISFVDGAILGCSGITAYQATETLNMDARDSVAIYGLGPVGLCAVLIAKTRGSRVIGVELSEERSRLARKLGIDEITNPSQEDSVTKVRDFGGVKGGVDSAIDSTGNPDATRSAIKSVKNGGKVALIGIGPKMQGECISPQSLIDKGIIVAGINESNINLWFDLVNLMISRKMSFEPIVSSRFPLGRAEEAFREFDTLGTGKIAFYKSGSPGW
jgi:threonine dehydrogenase-like Zn-dependent dehydrogenase